MQFKMKKSSMQQHQLKEYVEFTVYEKPDKMKKTEICNRTGRKMFFKMLSNKSLYN